MGSSAFVSGFSSLQALSTSSAEQPKVRARRTNAAETWRPRARGPDFELRIFIVDLLLCPIQAGY
jgi:hypothetical protein